MFDKEDTANPIFPGFGFIGHLRNGQVHGPFWVGMLNGGYLHGYSNEQGLLTGKVNLIKYTECAML